MEIQRSTSTVILLLFLVTASWHISHGSPTLSECGLSTREPCAFMFIALQQAFTSNKNFVYRLQRTFYPVETLSPIIVDVMTTVTVSRMPEVSCSENVLDFGGQTSASGASGHIDSGPIANDTDVCSPFGCTSITFGPWEHQWTKSIFNFVIERENLELLENVNFVAFVTAAFNYFDTSLLGRDIDSIRFNTTTPASDVLRFNIQIPELICIPEEDAVLQAWEDILPWLQQYAESRGNIEEFAVSKRGFIFRESNSDSNGILLEVLTAVHILLNVAVALIIMRLVTSYYISLGSSKSHRTNSPTVSIYWENVFIALAGNLVLVGGNFALYSVLGDLFDISPEALTFRIVSDGTVGVLIVLQLFIAIITKKHAELHIPFIISYICCCGMCCNGCNNKSRRNFLRFTIQTVAIWILMVFLQLIAASVIPVAVVCLRNPVPSIAFVTLMASTLFCLVIFVAHLVYVSGNIGSIPARERFSLVLQAFVFLVFFGIVSLGIVAYLTFVQAGATSNSVVGIVVPLVPSLVISAVAWYTKRQLQHRGDDDEEDETAGREEKSVTWDFSAISHYATKPFRQTFRKGSRKGGSVHVPTQREDDAKPEVVIIEIDNIATSTLAAASGAKDDQQGNAAASPTKSRNPVTQGTADSGSAANVIINTAEDAAGTKSAVSGGSEKAFEPLVIVNDHAADGGSAGNGITNTAEDAASTKSADSGGSAAFIGDKEGETILLSHEDSSSKLIMT